MHSPNSVCRLLEGIAALQEAGKTVHERPQEWFLQQLLRQEQQAVKVVSGLEFNQSAYNKVDTTRLAWPRHSTSSLLPLLRCVGLVHALRILSALLSERRVIMVSTSATRLAACSNAALSMLEQGLLHWQHLYIPVLPPHLRAYLAAPYPYLIGLLSWPSQTDGLGEVLVIHLDTNQLETRGMTPEQVASRLPDMFVSLPPGAAASNCEMLAQDLEQVLKMDKKILYGESTLQQMGETAAKAGKAVKKTFFKLRDKGRDLLNKNKDSPAAPSSESGGGADEADPDAKPSTPDYIYTESCHNSQSEEEARIAFASFFLCLVGDMRWYLTTDAGQRSSLGSEQASPSKASSRRRRRNSNVATLAEFLPDPNAGGICQGSCSRSWSTPPSRSGFAPLYPMCSLSSPESNRFWFAQCSSRRSSSSPIGAGVQCKRRSPNGHDLDQQQNF